MDFNLEYNYCESKIDIILNIAFFDSKDNVSINIFRDITFSVNLSYSQTDRRGALDGKV